MRPEIVSTDLYHIFGMELLRSGRVEEAVNLFRQVVVRAGHDLRLKRDLGMAYLSFGQHVDALRIFFDLLRVNPADPDTLTTLGDCYLAAGDAAAADAFYKRAEPLAADPEGIRVRRCLAAERSSGPARWLIESGLPMGGAAVKKHLASLTQRSYRRPPAADVQPALELLSEILGASDPASTVRVRLGEVLACLPTLITLTAVQAEQEGDPRRAQALAQLAKRAII